MRKLLFKTFVKQYLVDVSGHATLSIHKLVVLSENNVRIIDPLVLHCLLENKIPVLLKYCDFGLRAEIIELDINNYLNDSVFDFQKIHQSYIRRTNAFQYDLQTKSMIRNDIIKLMKGKSISKYRIYTDLSLNPGNINDYLTNGNSKKLSLKTAKRIYDYCLKVN